MKFIAENEVYLKEIIAENPDTVTEITVPEGFLLLTEGVFSPFKNLEKVVLPRSLTALEVGAFAGCTRLCEIVMPGIDHLARDYFVDCVSVETLRVPKTLEFICSDAFLELKGLKRVVFEGLDNFRYCEFIAFNGLTDKKIALPEESERPVYEYKPEMGKYRIDGRIAKRLRGKAPVVQAREFAIEEHTGEVYTGGGVDTSGYLCVRTEIFLNTFVRVRGFIVDDGLLVGYTVSADNGEGGKAEIPLLAGATVPVYTESCTVGGDNNGAGYKGGESFDVKKYYTLLHY
ncbi:MAG: leucine-rich repeat protein [Clostridia bacterium]|nr:leucine-rich repeat protein [Clostridia bacterium]